MNGLWRFGYYRIFSGKSMEDIPIGFNIKIGDLDIMSTIENSDIQNSISKDRVHSNQDIGIRENSWIGMI